MKIYKVAWPKTTKVDKKARNFYFNTVSENNKNRLCKKHFFLISFITVNSSNLQKYV
jgi:DNA-dependent RNA polymerase auxiliary subunit epsilon